MDYYKKRILARIFKYIFQTMVVLIALGLNVSAWIFAPLAVAIVTSVITILFTAMGFWLVLE